MANKDLFKQAIAEAKSVREAAIANAKEALEESLTPHLKDMLAAKLQQLEETEEETAKAEELVAEGEMAFSEAEAKDDSEESEDDAAAGEEEAPESEEAPEGEGEAEEDAEVGDLSVEDFKSLIRDIIAQEMGSGVDAGEPIPGEELPADDMNAPAADVADSEEIDLEELLKELEGMAPEAGTEEAPAEEAGLTKEAQIAELEAKLAELKGEEEELPAAPEEYGGIKGGMVGELNEALDTIKSLQKDLSEVNLLNAKLLYLNKVLKANNLTETQQVNVIAAFDKAETVKEVKLVFETISESLVPKKEAIKESKGFASKATGTTASKPEVIAEVSDAVRRMQKLAGII